MPRRPEALTLALAISEVVDDDDDFQDSAQAISLTQSLILSSIRNTHGSKPLLKPSSNASSRRPRKRSKPLAGKENRGVPENLQSDSSVSKRNENKNTKKEMEMGILEERGNLLLAVDTHSVETPTVSRSGDLCAVDESTASVEFQGNCGTEAERCDLFAPIGHNSAAIPEHREVLLRAPGNFGEGEGSRVDNRCYYSMSIESRLLASRPESGDGLENGCVEDGGSDDFEPGTQLKELMNLCSGMDGEDEAIFTEGNGSDTERLQVLGVNTVVTCPLCGIDITNLNEELQLIHTNGCLDRDENSTITVSTDETNPTASRPAADVIPVLEWLRTLGLSKYEDAFAREEIDWVTLQWLTEEDLLNIGIVALGPRKKIVHALSELRNRNGPSDSVQTNVSMTTADGNRKQLPGNKLITEYFQGPAVDKSRVCNTTKALHRTEMSKKVASSRRATGKNSNGKFREIPSWCCIPGTSFRVDAFRYLRGDCSYWFLTHFHLDHYQGLTRNFCHGKIYCSSITAHLLNMKIGIPWERLHVLPLNQKFTIAGVSVTCLDANHCPGSIIILFEPPNGKAVLHTGDFRFCEEMARNFILQSCHIHTLILDTTYCNPQYDFPKQEAVIQFVIEAIQAEAFNTKALFLIGSYTIGKERLFLEVARLLRKKVYVGAAKLQLLQCLGLPQEDLQWFTVNDLESHVHIVPMWTIASFKRMKHISNRYSNRFNLIIAFSPTGWTFGKGKKKSPGRRWQQGTIIRYEVPYSEHCSFTELREFVELLSPDTIIPSVNNDGPESADAMVALLRSDVLNPVPGND